MAPRFHLTLPEHLADEPVIYRLGREFDVITNIRRANIDDRLSWMILEISGAPDDIGGAVAWLEECGIQVDRIEDEG
jgi:L-aspartate semialdehyde sulfurtransferase ferredoxin